MRPLRVKQAIFFLTSLPSFLASFRSLSFPWFKLTAGTFSQARAHESPAILETPRPNPQALKPPQRR